MKPLFLMLALLALAQPALAYRAPPLPEEQWNEDTQLTLARAMVGEADWHEPDHIAIAFVLARRWRTHQLNREPLAFQRYVALYAASLRNDSDRSLWIRALPWGPIAGPYEQRWARVLKLVQAWGQGIVKDPCPSAMHWGGTMDRPSRRWSPVSCGMTRNIFYTRKPRASLAAVSPRRASVR